MPKKLDGKGLKPKTEGEEKENRNKIAERYLWSDPLQTVAMQLPEDEKPLSHLSSPPTYMRAVI